MEISLRPRDALMVANGASSHKIDYITIFKEILNIKRNQNHITGSRVLLNGWIFPIGQSSEATFCVNLIVIIFVLRDIS